MTSHILLQVASILMIGVTAQWLAWRLHIPSIIVLLIAGFVAGPISGFLQPTELLGPLQYPLISLLVSIVVFEGGLSLRIMDLKSIGKPLRNIISIGTLLTYIIITAASYYILGLDFELSVIFGAMMVLTGPTVIIPMLRHVKLSKQLGNLIRWEGILIEPVGVLVIVFSHQLITHMHQTGGAVLIALTLGKIILLGSLIGVIGALVVLVLIKNEWAPDDLQEAITLMLVVAVFTFSNMIESDSGIISVVVMGIALANQRKVMVRHIIVFKENLRILAISTLFIILAASVDIQTLMSNFGLNSLLFLLVLIFISRPIPIFLSTIGTGLKFKEKVFLSWMAPRGIIAAALASLFSLELMNKGIANAEQLVPLTFMVIIVTVSLYGLTADKLQQWLKLSDPNSSGVLMVGASLFSRRLATLLDQLDIHVLLVDTNKDYIVSARVENIPSYHRSIFSNKIHEEVQLGGYGSLLAMTASDEVNMLALIQYNEEFGKDHVYRLVPESRDQMSKSAKSFSQGRTLFGKGVSFQYINARMNAGGEVSAIPISDTFTYATFKKTYGDRAIVLMVRTKEEKLLICHHESAITPKSGDTVIALI